FPYTTLFRSPAAHRCGMRRRCPFPSAPAPFEVAASTVRRRARSSAVVFVDGNELDDLELAVAAGRGDLHRVARLLVEEGAPERRGRGDEPFGRVCVLMHDELKHLFLAVALDDVYRRAESRAVVRNAIDVHDRNLRDTLLQHADARLDETLPLLGRGVFRVLAQIAELARALDFLRQLQLQLAIERRDFSLELPDQPFLH